MMITVTVILKEIENFWWDTIGIYKITRLKKELLYV